MSDFILLAIAIILSNVFYIIKDIVAQANNRIKYKPYTDEIGSIIVSAFIYPLTALFNVFSVQRTDLKIKWFALFLLHCGIIYGLFELLILCQEYTDTVKFGHVFEHPSIDYLYSILIGLALSFIMLLTPILTGIFGRLMWPIYVGLGIYVPFLDLGVPVLPYVLISAFVSFQGFKLNNWYSQNEALSSAPEWAARCQVSYLFIVIGSYLVSWFI